MAVKTGGTVGGDPERNGAVLGVIGVTRDVPLWRRDVVMRPQLCVGPLSLTCSDRGGGWAGERGKDSGLR